MISTLYKHNSYFYFQNAHFGLYSATLRGAEYD